jgi:cytochrome bd-type quinol oxidase subunit 1
MALFHAHSGIRYLVFMFAVIAIVYIFYALLSKKPYDKTARILGIIFISTLDLNVLLGIILIVVRGYFSFQLMHIIFMTAALVAAHVFTVNNKKREQPSYQIALYSIIVPIILIILGINQLPG